MRSLPFLSSVDKKIRADVIAELEREPSIDAASVGVAVDDGVVTLSGYVESYLQKSRAEAAALRVRGVRAVAEEIKVRIPKRFSTSDDEIARRVLDVIRLDVRFPSDWIRPVVENGNVTLKGEVDWQYQRVAAEECVRHVVGVTDIHNHITLRLLPAADDLQDRVAAALQRNSAVGARSIRLSVEKDRVVLEGCVQSQAELNAVKQAVWAAPGVQSIDDHVKIAESIALEGPGEGIGRADFAPNSRHAGELRRSGHRCAKEALSSSA
jgi:osmotically-inducible protein OsmY